MFSRCLSLFLSLSLIIHHLPPLSPFTCSLLDAARRLGRTIQGGLPVVGLLSRLTATGGGVGWDELAYPEFCRALADADSAAAAAGGASPGTAGPFATALAAWATRHGRVGQARNVNLCLWMATTGGGGLVPARDVMRSCRRLAVTQDLEIEVERFAQARAASLGALKFGPRPAASLAVQAALAVDSLSILTLGLADGAPVTDEADVSGLNQLVPPALAQGAAALARAVPAGSASVAATAGVSRADLERLVGAAVASRSERATVYSE
jgi:1,3-beta-glucan synthase